MRGSLNRERCSPRVDVDSFILGEKRVRKTPNSPFLGSKEKRVKDSSSETIPRPHDLQPARSFHAHGQGGVISCPSCSRGTKDLIICSDCGQMGCFFCSNPPKCISCQRQNTSDPSVSCYSRTHFRRTPSPQNQRKRSISPIQEPSSPSQTPSTSSSSSSSSSSFCVLSQDWRFSRTSPDHPPSASPPSPSPSSPHLLSSRNSPPSPHTSSSSSIPPLPKNMSSPLLRSTSPTPGIPFSSPCPPLILSQRHSQSRSVSPSRPRPSECSLKTSSPPLIPHSGLLPINRCRSPAINSSTFCSSRSSSPPLPRCLTQVSPRPSPAITPPKKVFESQQSISLKLESTVKGIEDDKKEIERLRNQMEKIEASLMKKEVNLSQLEWQNECSRSLDEDIIEDCDEKGWSATEYQSLKKALDSVKSLFTKAPQSTSAETKEEIQERDITIQTAFKNLSSLSARAYKISKVAPNFDVCCQLKGNGWRSFLSVLESSLQTLHSQLKKNDKKWWRTISRNSTSVRYIETWDTISSIAVDGILKNCPPGSLFPSDNFEGVLNDFLCLPLEVFYGKFFGIHFEKGLRRILGLLLVAMASFGDGVKSGEGVRGRFRALMTSTKYLAFNKKAAERTVELFGSGDINFLKAFWGLQETVSFVELDTAIRTPTPSLNMIFKVNVGVLNVPAKNWPELVTIDIWKMFERHNKAHHSKKHYDQQEARNHREETLSKSAGTTTSKTVQVDFDKELKRGIFSAIQVRIISYFRHKGQLSANGYEKLAKAPANERSWHGFSESSHDKEKGPLEENWVEPMASGLLIHIHGGGFVAQTSKAHLNYLRDYAKAINAPIFSIDYSLSPENPFPQPVYEAFYAYCWAISHAKLLGTKADRVVITGDSAGGNLVIAVTMLAIQEGIRVPDAIVPIYPALLAKRVPSPARILSVMDPLLGTGVLLQCLHCYSAGLEVADPLLSPTFCSDEILKQFPPVQIICGKLDPLLDDSILFVNHLKRNGKPAILQLLDGLPHGFLGFNRVCYEATTGTKAVIEHLRFAFQISRFPPFPSVLDLLKNPNLLDPDSPVHKDYFGPETPDKSGPVVVIQVFDNNSDSLGYLQVKDKSIQVAPKQFLDPEHKSFLFQIYQRRCKNLDNERLLFSMGIKNLERQKFVSQNSGKLTLSDTMTETEFIDMRSPVWKMTIQRTEVTFSQSEGHTLTVGTKEEAVNFKILPQETNQKNNNNNNSDNNNTNK